MLQLLSFRTVRDGATVLGKRRAEGLKEEGFIYEPLALNCLTNFWLTNLTCLPTETGLKLDVGPKALSLPNPISKTFKGSEGLNTQAVVRYPLSHLVNLIPHKQEGDFYLSLYPEEKE